MNEVDFVRITTIVDNNIWNEELASCWGLSFYVETITDDKTHVVLMDTSGSMSAFSRNASKLGLNLSEVDAVLISHWHSDHCGALSHLLPLLKPQTTVYVPSENAFVFKQIRSYMDVPRICHKPIEFISGMLSTGEMFNGIREHSLLINVKNKGLVILVGCSHPGIINILKRAQSVSGVNKIFAVMGGFHMSSIGEGTKVGKFLRELDVKLVSPCHCTSVDAKQGIAKVVGEGYVKNGSGKIIAIS
jgi:7,8-dihydropterin-6-yl-methyl-4-(beta-D-ribofuranosyl)aminobenzene 5'-phosphate synthase